MFPNPHFMTKNNFSEDTFRAWLLGAERNIGILCLRWFVFSMALAFLSKICGPWFGWSEETANVLDFLTMGAFIVSAFQAGSWSLIRRVRSGTLESSFLKFLKTSKDGPISDPISDMSDFQSASRPGTKNKFSDPLSESLLPRLSSIHAFASLDDAAMSGWTFYEIAARFNGAEVPLYAHHKGVSGNQDLWFEFEGLLGDNETPARASRCFGRLLYAQRATAPTLTSSSNISPEETLPEIKSAPVSSKNTPSTDLPSGAVVG